jgi:hypothetical protein
MRTGISFSLTPKDRDRLLALVADRNAAQKHVWRARIALLTADGLGTCQSARNFDPRSASKIDPVSSRSIIGLARSCGA